MKKQIIVLFLVFILFSPTGTAQNFSWARTMGVPLKISIGIAVTTDKFGNVYNGGQISGTVDFDPGPGDMSITVPSGYRNAFLSKHDAAGNILWAKGLIGNGGAQITHISIDRAGSIYCAGNFSDSIDFDPGPGTYYMNGKRIFLVKLDSQGNFTWGASWAGSIDAIGSMTLDKNDNVIVTGSYSYAQDFDPGPGVFNLPMPGVASFVVKLDADRNFIWAKHIKGGIPNGQFMVTVDYANNLVLAGSVLGTGSDFDPGPGVASITAHYDYDIFTCKWDADGNFKWLKNLPGYLTESLIDVETDPSGNIYLMGGFNGSIDCDPGPDSAYYVVSQFNTDMFVARYTEDFRLKWSRRYRTQAINGKLEVDNEGIVNVVASGYNPSVDIDPGPSEYILTNASTFLSKLDWGGNFINGHWIAPTGYTTTRGFHIDSLRNLYITGNFTSTGDFDPGPGVDIHSTSDTLIDADIYLSKFAGPNLIKGSLYWDANGDNIRQPGELPVVDLKVQAQNGTKTYFGYADELGNYRIETDSGTYVVKPVLPNTHFGNFPVSHQAVFNSFVGLTDVDNEFAIKVASPFNDLAIEGTPYNVPRINALVLYQLKFTNSGTTPKSGTVSLLLDNRLLYQSASMMPSSQTGQLLTWTYSNLSPMSTRTIDVLARVGLAGTGNLLESTATINPLAEDSVAANNTCIISQTIVGSYDPNDKTVSPVGNITPDFVSQRKFLDYTIRFQNTGNDTAIMVYITDTISANADLNSLEFIASSHPCKMIFRDSRVVIWRFDQIMLPDSTTNEIRSHGFVRYRVKTNNNLVVGDRVLNKANIFFDFNPPVITNQTSTLVSIATGVNNLSVLQDVTVFPNPAKTLLNIKGNGRMEVRLLDIKGRLVGGPLTIISRGEIMVSNYPPGIYLLQVRISGKQKTFKILLK